MFDLLTWQPEAIALGATGETRPPAPIAQPVPRAEDIEQARGETRRTAYDPAAYTRVRPGRP